MKFILSCTEIRYDPDPIKRICIVYKRFVEMTQLLRMVESRYRTSGSACGSQWDRFSQRRRVYAPSSNLMREIRKKENQELAAFSRTAYYILDYLVGNCVTIFYNILPYVFV